jgi:cytochrome c-type biogenesis protein CcmF
MAIISKDGMRYSAMPVVALKENQLRVVPDTVVAQSLIIRFNKLVDGNGGKLELGIKEDKSVQSIITLKVYQFPFINLLWLGIVVMVFGFLMSMAQRIRTGFKTSASI